MNLKDTESRAFQCNFCLARFNRRDALMRHWRTCKDRLKFGQPIPNLSQQKRGRKQHACDRCAQRKRGCSQTLPCNSCIEHGHECTYFRYLQSGEVKPTGALLPDLEKEPKPSQALGQASVALLASSNIPWTASADKLFQAETVATDQFSEVPTAEKDALDSLDIDGGPDLLPMVSQSLEHEPKIWPTTSPWNMSLMTVFGRSFPSITRPKLAFLARFTSTDGIANSFDCGEVEQRKLIMSFLLNDQLNEQSADNTAASSSITQPGYLGFDMDLKASHRKESALLPLSWSKRVETLLTGIPLEHNDAAHASWAEEWYFDDLSIRTQEIVSGIQDVVQHKGRKSPITITWSPPREMLCYRFFSPSNLKRFLLAFWAIWYPNWPVFHKPTFFATQKPATLLAAMALIGASLTSETTDRDQAMVWADAVEEWVFSSDDFCDDKILCTDDEFEEFQIDTRLNALRASFATVLLLTWEGSEEQKKRARRVRYSQVIAVARSLRFSSARHESTGAYVCATDQLRAWKTFTLREELIRSLMFVFMLDCGYLIFNNCPPRMAAFELQCDLACPEVCFQAETLESWLQFVRTWSETQIGQRRPLLTDVVEMVTRHCPSNEDWEMLRQMSSLNFFAVANVFHNLIFHLHCGPTPTAEDRSITQGLIKWGKLWKMRQQIPGLLELPPTCPRDMWKRIGFMQYAQEFWSLAYIIYKQPIYKQRIKIDGAQVPGGKLRKGVLQSFDESNMGQVHELIMQFQDLSFGGE